MNTLVVELGRGEVLVDSPVFAQECAGPALTLTELLTPRAPGHIYSPEDRPHAAEQPFFALVVTTRASARVLIRSAENLERALAVIENATAVLGMALTLPREGV